jgi:LysR family carnitine catabolism transcriptional activator
MKVRLRQIEGFLAVAETLSFTRAADRLGMTQPAFSQLIRELESSLGLSLLDRTTRRVRVSAAGKSLLDRMRRGVAELDDACRYAQAMARLETGELTLAVLPSFASGVVLRALSTFRDRYPEMGIRIVEEHNAQILAKLAGYEVELAIGSQMDSPHELAFEPFMTDELVCVLPAGHPLARQDQIAWAELEPESIILVAASSQTYQTIRSNLLAFANHKLADYESLNSVTALAMARAGFGLTFIPMVALAELNMSGLVCRKLGEPHLLRSIGIYRRANQALSPGAAEFRKILLEQVASLPS